MKTGRTNDEVKADRDALWNSQAPAASAEIDLAGAVAAPMPQTHRADARDARHQAVQRRRLAVRDQVGRLPRAGGRRRRQGPDLDAQPQRRRDLLPEAAERRRPGSRRSQAIVDGEVVALDDDGRPDFSPAPDEARREGRRAGSSTRRSTCSISMGGRCSTSRSRIASACCGACSRSIRGSGSRRTSRARARRSTRRRRRNGVEGIVAKLRRSRYEPGRRTNAWLKLKIRPEQELVVGGWTPGEGNARDLGALAVGVYEDGKLRFSGKVGSRVHGRDPQGPARERLQPLTTDDAAVRPAAAQGLPRPLGRRPRRTSRGSGRSS